MTEPALPDPPPGLAHGDVRLELVETTFGDPSIGLVPAYRFAIVLAADRKVVGRISLRIGDTRHITHAAGHIGYTVDPAFRGHGYAYQACVALAPLVSRHSASVIITCNPDNIPSRRTIEKLGASFLGELPVDPADIHYSYENRVKRRYLWTPKTTSSSG